MMVMTIALRSELRRYILQLTLVLFCHWNLRARNGAYTVQVYEVYCKLKQHLLVYD